MSSELMTNHPLTADELAKWHRRNFQVVDNTIVYCEGDHQSAAECRWVPLTVADVQSLLAAVREKGDLIDGYKQVVTDMRRNSKLIAVTLFGDDAPEQPSLCDVVCYVESEFASLRAANAELQKEADLQRLRVASLLFSGVFDNFTGGQIVAWANEYEDAKKLVTELRAENERQRDYISLIEQEISERELTAEGLKVWRPDEAHDNEDFVDGDFIAIRESLPTISGCGASRPGALMQLAAAATLMVETMNDEVLSLRAQLDKAEKENERLKQTLAGYQREVNEVEQVIGKALGYPRYCDDLKNFPNATEADGVCVGEHTPVTVARELVGRFEQSLAEAERVKGLARELASAILAESNWEYKQDDERWLQFYSSTIGDMTLLGSADYLVSVGVLEKYPERSWYRWKEEGDGNA